MVYGGLGVLWPLAPMHSRAVLAAGGGTWTDTWHLILAGATVLLMLAAIVVAARAFGPRFRVYSIVSLTVLLVCGAATFESASRVGRDLPTPWLGVWQRINLSMFLLWIAILAFTLLRSARAERERRTAGYGSDAARLIGN